MLSIYWYRYGGAGVPARYQTLCLNKKVEDGSVQGHYDSVKNT